MTFIAADFQLEELEEKEAATKLEFWGTKYQPRRGKPRYTPESKMRQDQTVLRLLEAIEEQEKKPRRNPSHA